MPLRWHVVQSKRLREEKAAFAIACYGFETFLPVMQVVHRHYQRIETRTVPRFQSYLFARFDPIESWSAICHDEGRRAGVIRVLCDAQNHPRPVPERAMAAIRAYNPPNPEIEPLKHVFHQGQAVTVYRAGKPQQAVYVGGSARRAFVQLWILGAERLVEVPNSAIEPVIEDLTEEKVCVHE